MARREVNCSVGLPPHLAKHVFQERIWYCPSDMFDEIRDIKDRVRIIFFAAQREVSEERTEIQVLGYYFYPEHKGKAVFDRISRTFLHSDTGSHDVISAEGGEAIRFIRYVKLPHLQSKHGHSIWQFDDSDAMKILQIARDIHLQSEDPQEAQGIVSSIQTVLADIEERAHIVSPDISQEYGSLSPWLRDRLDNCQVSGLPARGFVQKLIALAQEKKNHDYYLQAAKLQVQDGDYKFVITLANYCLAIGYEALANKQWDDAFDIFLEGARLYQRDPMITDSDWKVDQRLRCLRLATQMATSAVLDSNRYSLPESICVEMVEKKVAKALRRQLQSHQIRKLIREGYYVQSAEHLLGTDRRSDFLSFYEDAPDDIEFPQWMTLRYYREKSRELAKKDGALPEDFVQAAEYRKRAADLLAQDEGDKSVSYREEMVDYHRCLAIASARRGEMDGFSLHIDKAIELAEALAEDPEATDLHRQNLHFVRGMKHGEVARHEIDPRVAAEHYFQASKAYLQVGSAVATARSLFHQLMGYQASAHSKLGKAPEDFEQAAMVCREALAELWSTGRIEALQMPDELLYRALFEALCLLTTDHLSAEKWHDANRFHERVQTESVKEPARQIWNLAYGTRLIEASGVTLEEVTAHLRAAVRSAIFQLLENKVVSETELYDDLVAVQLGDEDLQRKKRILSLLRQRQLSTEGLEVECKEFLYDPNYESLRIISSLHEAVISFLNSSNGGQIIIGVEDGTFVARGIEQDLQRFGRTEGELKDAIVNHVYSKVQEGLPLPSIIVSFEPVEAEKKVIYIDVPPGHYLGSLYKNREGVAFIRVDGSQKTIRHALEQDELAEQRRQSKGPWAVRGQ